MVFFLLPFILLSVYILNQQENLFQSNRPQTSNPNRAVKVNGKEEVANCFIQSLPLSASAVKNWTLDNFRS